MKIEALGYRNTARRIEAGMAVVFLPLIIQFVINGAVGMGPIVILAMLAIVVTGFALERVTQAQHEALDAEIEAEILEKALKDAINEENEEKKDD